MCEFRGAKEVFLKLGACFLGLLGGHLDVLGPLWNFVRVIVGRFGTCGGTIREVGGEFGHMYVRKSGVLFRPLRFWLRKMCPGAAPESPRGFENRP